MKTLPSELNTIVSDSSAPRPRRRACVATSSLRRARSRGGGGAGRRERREAPPAQLATDGGPNGDDDYHLCLGEPLLPRPRRRPRPLARRFLARAQPAAASTRGAVAGRAAQQADIHGVRGGVVTRAVRTSRRPSTTTIRSPFLHDDAFAVRVRRCATRPAVGNGDDDITVPGQARPCHDPPCRARRQPAPIPARRQVVRE